MQFTLQEAVQIYTEWQIGDVAFVQDEELKVQFSPPELVQNCMEEQIWDVPVRQFQEDEIMNIVQFISQEPVQNCTQKHLGRNC